MVGNAATRLPYQVIFSKSSSHGVLASTNHTKNWHGYVMSRGCNSNRSHKIPSHMLSNNGLCPMQRTQYVLPF